MTTPEVKPSVKKPQCVYYAIVAPVDSVNVCILAEWAVLTLIIDTAMMLQFIVNVCACGALECMLSLGVGKHFVCPLCFASHERSAKPWTLTL